MRQTKSLLTLPKNTQQSCGSFLPKLGGLMQVKSLQTVLLIALTLLATTRTHSSLRLSTRSRWIVSPSGERYKLRCGNWVGHLHAMVAEGLNKQPLKDIAATISSLGFNCVRLTWATYMFTRPNYSNLTVEQSLDQWNLEDAKAGIAQNNPRFLSLSLGDAQKAVVDELGAHNIVVVLDNHVSLPQWCCSNNDGNGFFGDEHFDPNEWLQGLITVANRYKGNPTVVGMSMRNELRGPRQNQDDWYKYMEQGATAIHRENPDVLVIVSGLSYDTNLGFLKQRPFGVNVGDKLVFESHWYSFGNPLDKWLYQTNEFCGNVTRWFLGQSGFLVMDGSSPFPLFLSEFGMNQQGTNQEDDLYFSCLLALVAEKDLDWSLWALQGSYMLREGSTKVDELYGMFSANWDHVRNSTMPKRLQFIQQITQDPMSNDPSYYIMYHPQTGQCVQVGRDNIYASDCDERWGRWSHDGDGGPIRLMGDSRCLSATGDGLPVILSDDCSSEVSMWSLVSGSNLHIAAKGKEGGLLCLDLSSSNSSTILTAKCLCLGDDSKDVPKCVDNPQRQWFKLVPSNKT